MLLPQNGRPQEAPLEEGWIKRSSIIRNMKHEIRNVIIKYGTQIFTYIHR